MRWTVTATASVVVFGLLLGFLALEVLVRIGTGTLLLWGDPDVVEPTIGQMMRPGISLHNPFTGFRVTIGDYSTRRNGNPDPPRERPLTLAVGDSFTFGEDVSDPDAWPALLERILGSRVINGGAPGFGLDQIVLRAEQLSSIYRPDVSVVSFIPDDVSRCGAASFSGHAKPYFEIDGNELRMHPITASPPSLVRRVMAQSIILHLLFYNLIHADPESAPPHASAHDVACLLMNRLAALGAPERSRVIVLAQPQAPFEPAENVAVKDHVLACARRRGLETLDLFSVLERMPPLERNRLFRGHMTPEGNEVVAKELANVLSR